MAFAGSRGFEGLNAGLTGGNANRRRRISLTERIIHCLAPLWVGAFFFARPPYGFWGMAVTMISY